MQLSGRAAVLTPFVAIADDIEANIVILPGVDGAIVLVGLDTLFSSQEFETLVLSHIDERERGKIAAIFFIASHTHNAPALDPGKPRLGVADADHMADVASRVGKRISQAARTRSLSVHVQRGDDRCELNVMRRRKGWRLRPRWPFLSRGVNMTPDTAAVIPQELKVVVARDADGLAQWVVWTWCCHPTAFPEFGNVSADFPGTVRRAIREHLGSPDLPVVFLPGFCGDVRADPSILPVSFRSLAQTPFQRPFARATERNYARLCEALSRAVRAAIDRCGAAEALAPARAATVTFPLERILAGNHNAGDRNEVAVSCIEAGPVGFLLVGAEVCSIYVGKCLELISRDWLVSGYTGQVFGYLPDNNQVKEGGYEAEGFFPLFGLEGRFSTEVEAPFLDAVRAASRRISCNE